MLRVKKLHPAACVPFRATPYAAGYDLACTEDVHILPGRRAVVGTGLAVRVPEGTYGRVAPRSGLAARHGIDVLAGVVDRDYTGEVKVVLQNHGDAPFSAPAGTKIAQLVLERIETPDVVTVAEVGGFEDTDRGARGFGSTGA